MSRKRRIRDTDRESSGVRKQASTWPQQLCTSSLPASTFNPTPVSSTGITTTAPVTRYASAATAPSPPPGMRTGSRTKKASTPAPCSTCTPGCRIAPNTGSDLLLPGPPPRTQRVESIERLKQCSAENETASWPRRFHPTPGTTTSSISSTSPNTTAPATRSVFAATPSSPHRTTRPRSNRRSAPTSAPPAHLPLRIHCLRSSQSDLGLVDPASVTHSRVTLSPV
jgi:hypothetical protein